MPLTVSVVIAAYNAAPTLAACLDALAAQDGGPPPEVIVVDDASTDHTAEICAYYPFVQCVRLAANAGPGHARNAGVAQAKGEVIAFVDADALAERDWLRTHLAAQEVHDIVCGSIGVANPESRVGWAMYLMEFVDFFPGQPARRLANFTGCNVSMKRAVFEESGGFDPRYRTAEDRLLALGLSARHEIVFEPRARVRHINRTTPDAALRNAYRLGEGSGQIRHLVGKQAGGALLQFPALAYVAPFYRFGKMLAVVALRNRDYLPQVLVAGPLCLRLCFAWARGFRKGMANPHPG